MASLAEMRLRDDAPTEDHFVQLHEVSWEDYERLLEMRGDHSAPRIAYLEGTVEIMTPSRQHEGVKSVIGCLVEVYCLVAGIEFQTYGSWTIKERREERGVEPDECYVFGVDVADRPHLAIEVVWTAGGMNKLAIYRRLGVGEVWVWRRGQIAVHVLRGDQYESAPRSAVLPGIDLDELAGFLDRPTTSQAMREYRAALEARAGGRG